MLIPIISFTCERTLNTHTKQEVLSVFGEIEKLLIATVIFRDRIMEKEALNSQVITNE